jgi:hypothetical protein
LIVCCLHVNLHSIGTMMGFHVVTLWQNETFHFLYHISIIIWITLTRDWERRKQKPLLRGCRGGLLACSRNVFCVGLSSSSWRESFRDVISDITVCPSLQKIKCLFKEKCGEPHKNRVGSLSNYLTTGDIKIILAPLRCRLNCGDPVETKREY